MFEVVGVMYDVGGHGEPLGLRRSRRQEQEVSKYYYFHV